MRLAVITAILASVASRSAGPVANGAAGACLGPTEALVLPAGALLIALAWTLSLRARPLTLRRSVQR